METKTAETGRKANDVIVVGLDKSEAGKVLASRLAKLAGQMKTFSVEKVAKFAGKSINDDVKFVKFLNASYDDFVKQIPATFRDPDKIAKLVDALTPEKGEAYRPNVKQVQNALDALCTELVDVQIESKTKELSTYKIEDETVQQKIATQLTVYRKALMRCVHNAKAFKDAYGMKTEG